MKCNLLPSALQVFCTEKVTAVGLPIGVVVAETQALARRAAGLVKVRTFLQARSRGVSY